MKKLSLVLMLCILSFSAFAQKRYVDPNERQKRGLLEEGQAPTQAPSAPVVAENALTPQAQLCECVKLKKMNDQLEQLWYSGDKVIRASTSREEINGRDSNVESTMVHIVSVNKSIKPMPSASKCAGFEIGESNIVKLLDMIEKQEKKCDVYKLRGIDND